MTTKNLHPVPEWMNIDIRPMDPGEWQPFGYGYSRRVTSYERWRPATRYIRRKDNNNFKGFEILTLMPGLYYVSDHGRIWSANRGIIHYRKHKRSRTMLLLANGEYAWIRPYKLAIDNFVEPPHFLKNIVYYLMDVVNHIDNRPYNNKLNNVQYSTRPANAKHAKQFQIKS